MKNVNPPKTNSAFVEVVKNDSETNLVVCYRMIESGTVIATEVCVVSAYGDYLGMPKDKRHYVVENEGGSRPHTYRTPERAHSDAHEIASFMNGAFILAGMFDDRLEALYLEQREGSRP